MCVFLSCLYSVVLNLWKHCDHCFKVYFSQVFVFASVQDHLKISSQFKAFHNTEAGYFQVSDLWAPRSVVKAPP